MIYRDFFQFTLPGTQVFYLLLFKLFGVRAWIPSATWVLLGIGLAWTCVVISKQLLSGVSVYLPSLLFLGLGFVTERDPTHHWFSTLACMAAIAILMPKRSPARLVAAGALCGLATLFTQSRGIVAIAGFATFLLWECRAKKQGWGWLFKAGMYLFIPFLATTLPVLAYLAWKVGHATVYQLHGRLLDEVLVQMVLGNHLRLRGRPAGLASLAGGAGPADLALHPPLAAVRVYFVFRAISPPRECRIPKNRGTAPCSSVSWDFSCSLASLFLRFGSD